MSDGIICAYGFDGKGGAKELKGQAISDLVKKDELAWVHLDAMDEATRPWLEKEVSYLNDYILNALLIDETRPRMIQIGDGILMILRGVNLNDNADPEDMVSIRLWIDKHRIISVRRRSLKAVSDMREKLEKGIGPKNSGHFLSMLITQLTSRMQPSLQALDEKTDSLEESILNSADTKFRESIVEVRKQAIMFRRYMSPQKDALAQMQLADLTWLSKTDKRYLQEGYNLVLRYVEDLDAIRDRSQIIKDELSNMLADKLNKNMYVLSLIAAIFLPLSFLTGLLGINVGGIPGANDGNAFLIFCGILAAVIIVQMMIFKKLKWF